MLQEVAHIISKLQARSEEKVAPILQSCTGRDCSRVDNCKKADLKVARTGKRATKASQQKKSRLRAVRTNINWFLYTVLLRTQCNVRIFLDEQNTNICMS